MAALPFEIVVLGASTVLLLVHMMVQALTERRGHDPSWFAGPRDGDPPAPDALAGRAARAFDNFRETYPAFIALTLALAVTGQTGGMAEGASAIWLGARILYLPLYLAGIAWWRSAVFSLSVIALGVMFAALLGAA